MTFVGGKIESLTFKPRCSTMQTNLKVVRADFFVHDMMLEGEERGGKSMTSFFQ